MSVFVCKWHFWWRQIYRCHLHEMVLRSWAKFSIGLVHWSIRMICAKNYEIVSKLSKLCPKYCGLFFFWTRCNCVCHAICMCVPVFSLICSLFKLYIDRPSNPPSVQSSVSVSSSPNNPSLKVSRIIASVVYQPVSVWLGKIGRLIEANFWRLIH